jgi:hypothetical protein
MGVPFGDRRFIIYAVLLELSYISLAVLVAKGHRKALYACISFAILIVIGNSVVAVHIHRIITSSRPLNTIILIIGGTYYKVC